MAVIKSKGTKDFERKTLKLQDVTQMVAESPAPILSLPGFPEERKMNPHGGKASPRIEGGKGARMAVSLWTRQRERAGSRSMAARD